MRLTPRYDGPAVLRFTEAPGDLAVPLLRQRRRLGAVLEGLDAEHWSTQSRCESWSVRDVVAHLVGADQFWVLSTSAALAGEPTRYLDGFDPVVIPAQMVEQTQGQPPDEVLATYLAGVEAFADVVTGLDDAQWSMPAEGPPGHVALHCMIRHALWDAWVHERDIVLPLGSAPVEEPDEVVACLEYAAAVGPTFLSLLGTSRSGTLAVLGTDPTARVMVELGESVTVGVGIQEVPPGAVVLEGPSVELVEAFSVRAPFPCAVPDGDRWLLSGVPTVFDSVPVH
jgi:uncharacterized protein (TIGR03083 family)